MLKRYSYFQ